MGNHKSSRSPLNTAAMKKSIDKAVERRWELPQTIDSIRHIKKVGVVPLGVAELLSINKVG